MMSGAKGLYDLESTRTRYLVNGFESGVWGVLAGKEAHMCHIICTMRREIL